MSAGRYNFVFERGGYNAIPLTYSTVDEDGVTTPINMTGYAVRMHVRAAYGAADILLNLTTANGGFVLTDAVAGEFELIVNDSDGSKLANFDEGVYDIELVAPDTRVTKYLRGGVGVVPEVTITE